MENKQPQSSNANKIPPAGVILLIIFIAIDLVVCYGFTSFISVLESLK